MEDIPIIPGRGLNTSNSTAMRLDFLHGLNFNTQAISSNQLEFTTINKNIESFIGSTEIPVGIVGPLLFNNPQEQELAYCVAATLEGALVASMNRGARAISKSGGFSAEVFWQRMHRAPMFFFENNEEALIFKNFVEASFKPLKKTAEKYSNHARLIEIEALCHDHVVHLKFIYTTGDAAGQNMITTCTWHTVLHLLDYFYEEKGLRPVDFVIEGNGSSDKKVSQYSIQSGRGIRVSSTCFLKEEVIQRILRTSAEKIYQCFLPSKGLAKRDGMMGYNINVANTIAAIFAATGQDLGSLHESSVGFLDVKLEEDGLRLELLLPNLVIGTVGGGTHLPKQSEALEIMGCKGSGKVHRFAQLIAGFALSLEISTYAAIVSGEFARAHEVLGRNKPTDLLVRGELNTRFLTRCLNSFSGYNKIIAIEPVEADNLDNGILTDITRRASKKLIGFVPLSLTYQQPEKKRRYHKQLLLKSKALDIEVIKGLHIMAASIDSGLSDLIRSHFEYLEYKNCHLKELALYTYLHKQHYQYIPKFYGGLKDDKREIHLFIQERLDFPGLKMINTGNNPEKWERQDIRKAIYAASVFHKLFQTTDTNYNEFYVDDFQPEKNIPLYLKIASLLYHEERSREVREEFAELMEFVHDLKEERASLNIQKTIIHNDFNPRNIALRKNGEPVIYDWELAVVNIPHRDIVEFLSFTLQPGFLKEDLFYYLKYHFSLYQSQDNRPGWSEWIKGYRYALKEYLVSRVAFYEVAGIIVKYDFSERILHVAFQMIKYLDDGE
ncbi:MAG: phosphotransferase [Cyclobacteriaceae bacterium]|nr:phosphotransferase [Cyclobacteriaceae bacterium]